MLKWGSRREFGVTEKGLGRGEGKQQWLVTERGLTPIPEGMQGRELRLRKELSDREAMALGSGTQDGGGNETRKLNTPTSFEFGPPFLWYCLLLVKCKRKSEGSRRL